MEAHYIHTWNHQINQIIKESKHALVPCVWQGSIKHDALCGFLPPALDLSSNVLFFLPQFFRRHSLHFLVSSLQGRTSTLGLSHGSDCMDHFPGFIHVSFTHSHWIGHREPSFECEDKGAGRHQVPFWTLRYHLKPIAGRTGCQSLSSVYLCKQPARGLVALM